jgi:hypothetical protein
VAVSGTLHRSTTDRTARFLAFDFRRDPLSRAARMDRESRSPTVLSLRSRKSRLIMPKSYAPVLERHPASLEAVNRCRTDPPLTGRCRFPRARIEFSSVSKAVYAQVYREVHT